METSKFHNDTSMLKYFQKSLNIYCFSSLESAFDSIKQTNADNAIALRIEESLRSKVGNCIDVANNNFKNETNSKQTESVF